MLWVVMDSDGDWNWPVAAYESEALAEEHAKELNLLVAEAQLLQELPEEVTDPGQRAQRAAKAAADHLRCKQRFQAREEINERTERLTPEEQLARGAKLTLCRCQVFSSDPMWTTHGYCRYCGCWSPEIVRLHHGGDYLLQQIARLNSYDREKMLQLCGFAQSA